MKYLTEAREHRREQIRIATRKYRRKNLQKTREYARARDAANPEGKRERMKRFAERNPTYWRDFQRRRTMRLAWLKWTRTCAASRITPPQVSG